MRSTNKRAKRKTINLRASQEVSPFFTHNPRFPSEVEVDIQTCIDHQRNQLREVGSCTAKRIVHKAEQSLMHLLKAKGSPNCLHPRDSLHPFHNHICSAYQLHTLFDQHKLQKMIRDRKEKNQKQNNKMTDGPLWDRCQRRVQLEKRSVRKTGKSQLLGPMKDYCGLSTSLGKSRLVWL